MTPVAILSHTQVYTSVHAAQVIKRTNSTSNDSTKIRCTKLRVDFKVIKGGFDEKNKLIKY